MDILEAGLKGSRDIDESGVPVQAGRVTQVFVVPFVQLAVTPGRLWLGESDALCPPVLHVKSGETLRSRNSPEIELQTSHALPLGT